MKVQEHCRWMLVIGILFFVCSGELAWGRGAYPYKYPDPKLPFDPRADTVIGVMGEYVTKKKTPC